MPGILLSHTSIAAMRKGYARTRRARHEARKVSQDVSIRVLIP